MTTKQTDAALIAAIADDTYREIRDVITGLQLAPTTTIAHLMLMGYAVAKYPDLELTTDYADQLDKDGLLNEVRAIIDNMGADDKNVILEP